jgi:hypothetical protein
MDKIEANTRTRLFRDLIFAKERLEVSPLAGDAEKSLGVKRRLLTLQRASEYTPFKPAITQISFTIEQLIEQVQGTRFEPHNGQTADDVIHEVVTTFVLDTWATFIHHGENMMMEADDTAKRVCIETRKSDHQVKKLANKKIFKTCLNNDCFAELPGPSPGWIARAGHKILDRGTEAGGRNPGEEHRATQLHSGVDG